LVSIIDDNIKNRDEIDKMKKAGEVIKRLFEEIDKMDIIKIGTTTKVLTYLLEII